MYEETHTRMFKLSYEIKFVVIYLLIGSLWILFSDELLYSMYINPEKLTVLQTYKGLFFVFFTAIFLYIILKVFHRKLKRSELKAIESDRLKKAFVKNISHEIRTPINGISGFSQLLKDQTLTMDDKIEYINIIERSSQDLLLAVDGMMDLSLLEASGGYFQNISFDVVNMMENLYSHYKEYETKSVVIKLECNIGTGLRIINSDQSKIKLAFSHMINNAFKYTEDGYIKIGSFYDNRDLVFYVKDTGVGMSEVNRQKLLELFNNTRENKIEFKTGVGLGLSIAKSIINQLGGNIWLTSVEREGSTFFFSFPYNILKPRKSRFSIINN